MTSGIDDSLGRELSGLEEDGLLRSLRELDGRSGKWIESGGRKLLNLSSNDYLGYASDPELTAAFYAAQSEENLVEDFGLGSSASRLLSGNHSAFPQLEFSLEDLYGRPALVFTSGYHANIGILPALAGRKDLILVDRLAHASILDGVRLCQAEWRRYPHRDMDALRSMLVEKRSAYRRVFVVTESIFSMDGDLQNLLELVALKREFDVTLYVDEAHAVGVRGERGLGVGEEMGVASDVDILIGTFGKALAGMGAFVVCSEMIKSYLVNRCRSFIFTTALPPVIARWNVEMLQRMSVDLPRRKYLAELAGRFRSALTGMGVTTRGEGHIVPVILGDNRRALDMASRLDEQGYMALAVRPPTVPAGTARLRFSLSAGMAWEDLTGIFDVLKEAMPQ